MRIAIFTIVLLFAVAQQCQWCRGEGQELAVTPELERCVTRGLDFLARTQQENGAWRESCGNYAGVVGLAVLAFLAHGDLPDEGKYGQTIRRAVSYILSQQAENGMLCKQGGMYSHGFATLALAEVYGQMKDENVGKALKRATDLLVTSQNQLGGWRYSLNSSDADTTVTGAQAMALRAAANAGMEVPVSTVKRIAAYYKSSFCPGGGFGYTGPDSANCPRSGIGLLVLSLSGEYRSPEAKATADWLLNSSFNESGYFYYMCYYCSQAMFQAGGKYWRHWNTMMTPALIAMQQDDGSWPPNRCSSGPIGGTAFALLSIEINYNYLPIYQR